MKKILIILTLLVGLSGCGSEVDTIGDASAKYEQLVITINEHLNYSTKSIYFDIELEYAEIEENTYRYYLTINNPKIAMYNITAAADDVSNLKDPSLIMPSSGIFEDVEYNMIPFQYNPDKGYYEGILLSGIKTFEENEKIEFDLRLYVDWYNQDRSLSYKEFISVYAAEEVVEVVSEESELTEEEGNSDE